MLVVGGRGVDRIVTPSDMRQGRLAGPTCGLIAMGEHSIGVCRRRTWTADAIPH